MDATAASRLAKLEEVMGSVPYQYKFKDRLKSDLQQLFRVCATLQPQTGSFQGGGREVTLFYLYGVLPINYQGNAYNIPVTIYFDPPYPRQAPRCFVTPTGNMAVSQNHPQVDKGGMFYAPLLNQWSERSSNLVELITVMTSSFAQSPPVYSTAGQAAQPPQQTRPGPAPAQPQTQTQAQDGSLLGAIGGWFSQPPAGQSAAQPAATGRATQPVVASVIAQPVGVQRTAMSDQALVQRTTQALKERWPVVMGTIVSECNEQLEQRKVLKAEAAKLEQDLNDLKKQAETQVEQAKKLEAVEAELTSFVQANEGKEPSPDDLKAQLDPDSRQVLDMLAEELALDEFLVALDELLSARKLSIDDFLREVRDASRRRFMCSVQRKKSEAAVRAHNQAP